MADNADPPVASEPEKPAEPEPEPAPATVPAPVADPSEPPAEPAPKRRGRPPGSKNKPKPPKTVPAEEAVPSPRSLQRLRVHLLSLPLRGLSPRLRSPRPSPLG